MSLSRATLARVFWRCLFLQAAWNRRGMQGLGFAYAIDPALQSLYPDPGARRRALARHLGFFNCHPYMAAAILGGAIYHEERVARGEEPADVPSAYKATLQGPLAAVGDGFFWTALRPFFGALAVLLALTLGIPGVAVAIGLYNAVHLALRVRFFLGGYREGDGVVEEIRRMRLPARADLVRNGAAGLCGIAAALVAVRAGATLGTAAAVAAGASAVLGHLALARGARLLPAAYAAAAAGAGVGFLAGARGGP